MYTRPPILDSKIIFFDEFHTFSYNYQTVFITDALCVATLHILMSLNLNRNLEVKDPATLPATQSTSKTDKTVLCVRGKADYHFTNIVTFVDKNRTFDKKELWNDENKNKQLSIDSTANQIKSFFTLNCRRPCPILNSN